MPKKNSYIDKLGLVELSKLLTDCNTSSNRAAAYRRVREIVEKSGSLLNDGLPRVIDIVAETAASGERLWGGRALKTLCSIVTSSKSHLIPSQERIRIATVFGITLRSSDIDTASASAVGLSAPGLRYVITNTTVESGYLFILLKKETLKSDMQ